MAKSSVECNPAYDLTVTSWETLSQNHPANLLMDLDHQKLCEILFVLSYVLLCSSRQLIQHMSMKAKQKEDKVSRGK